MFKRKSLLFCQCVLALSFLELPAQTLISPSGSIFQNSDLNISWSIGEQFISTWEIDDHHILTQGYNQPFFLCESCLEIEMNNLPSQGKEDFFVSERILVFPNPVTTSLNIQTSIQIEGSGYMTIQNSEGRILYMEDLEKEKFEQLSRIDVTHYLPGTYYLKIFNGASLESAVFIKI